MLCTQIIAEYEKQTHLLERILEELEKLNAHRNRKAEGIGVHPPEAGRGRLISVKETAKYLGIAPSTIYNRISRYSGNPFPVKPKRVGRRVKFDIREIEDYLNSL